MGTNKQIPLGAKSFRPEELSSFLLRRLKEDAEHWLGKPVQEAVISVPAYFNDTQRKATRIAGQLAGFRVERLVNEPTAAALAYGLHCSGERKILVYDLGGGTFDVTILELYEGVMEVRASSGDNFLGGEDFVSNLIEYFMEKAGIPVGMPRIDPYSGSLYHWIRREAERAKISLSEATAAVMEVPWQNSAIRMEITADEFRSLSSSLLSRLRKPVEIALQDARIRPSELNDILLVGGATRMPLVKNLVARMFGRFPTYQINPDEAVALGVAVQAGLKERNVELREVVLTDMCPYTLGIEVVEEKQGHYESGLYLPIIERNTVIPASRVQRVTALENNQRELAVRVYQGESRKVANNIYLGSMILKLPANPDGKESADVRFSYDINGLLEVEATVVSTGAKRSVVIEGNPGALTSDEIRKRLLLLSSIKIHPRDQTENRTVLARAERLYEEHIRETRMMLGDKTSEFVAALNSQDPRIIAEARDRLVRYLDQVESQRPLYE